MVEAALERGPLSRGLIPASRLDSRAIGLMLLLCGLWGVQQVASKVALTEGIPPVFQALARSVVAGSLLVAWVGLRQGRAGLAALTARDGTLPAGLLTAAMFAAEFILLFNGVRRTSASHAVLLLFSGGLFTAIGAHLLAPGERLRPVNAAGLLLAFLGVAVTVGGRGPGGGASLVGDALVLAAAALWGFTTVVVKISPALMAAPAAKVLGYQLIGSAPLLAVAAWISGELAVPHGTALAWAALLYQCVVVAFASYLLWFWLVARYPAGRLAAFSVATPLLGVVAAWLLLGEPIGLSLLVGLVCVTAGLRMANAG